MVSTQEPGRTRTESENGDSFNGDLSVDIEMGDNFVADPLAPISRTAPEVKDEPEEPKTSSSPQVSPKSFKPDNLEEDEAKIAEVEKKPDELDSPSIVEPTIAAIIENIKKLPDLPEEKDEDLESTEATATIEKLLEEEDQIDDLKLPPIETISPLPSIAAILAPTIDSLVDTSTSEDSTDCIVPVVLVLDALKPEVVMPSLAEPKITENPEWLQWGDSPPENADGSQPSPAKRLKIDSEEVKVELSNADQVVTEVTLDVKPLIEEIQDPVKETSAEIPESLSVEEPIQVSETIPVETPAVESLASPAVEELEVLLAEVAEVLPIVSTEAELLAQNALEDKLLEEPEIEPPTKPEVPEVVIPEVLEAPEIAAIPAEIAEIPIIPSVEVAALPAIVPVEMEIATPAVAVDNKMSLDEDTLAAASLASSIADEAELLMSPVISKMDTDGAELNEMDVDESSGEPMDQ